MDLRPPCLLINNSCVSCQELLTIFNFLNIPLLQANSIPLSSKQQLIHQYSLIFICDINSPEHQALLTQLTQQFPEQQIVILKKPKNTAKIFAKTRILNAPLVIKELTDLLHQHQLIQDKNICYETAYPQLMQWMGASDVMQQLRSAMVNVAPGQSTLWLAGETGTDKELIAHTIHSLSSRAKYPFIPINCRTIPPEIIESELVGDESGTLTRQHTGCLELAEAGTLFIEEIEALSPALQNKLLDIIQKKQFNRRGGTTTRYLNARIILGSKSIATSADFYKKDFMAFNTCLINIAPLRYYLSDLPILLNYFSMQPADPESKPLQFTNNALRILSQYAWPENRLELRSFISTMMLRFTNKIIDEHDLPARYHQAASLADTTSLLELNQHTLLPEQNSFNLKEYLLNVEFSLIKKAAEKFDGNISHTAKYLQLGRTTLIEKIRKHNVDREEDNSLLEDSY